MPIVSDRLILRDWCDADRQPFADMSADPSVMEFLLPLATRDACDAWIDRQRAHSAKYGFCFWAVTEKHGGAFLGAVGLLHVAYSAHFTPAVELGWRIARACWGQGYAPEAAKAALQYGFDTLKLPEIVANAAVGNEKSRRVMAKLGMRHDPADDFDHPRVPDGSPLKRQVLYRLTLGR